MQGLHLLASEGQQLPGQVGRAAGGLLDLIHVTAQGMLGRQRIQHQLGVGTDDHQQIIKVVRHSSGQESDCIHFLCLLKLIFQPAPVRNVPVIGNKVRDLPVVVAQRRNGLFRDENLSILLAIRHSAAKDVARENGLPQLLVDLRNLLAGFQEFRVLSNHFRPRVTGQHLERRVNVLNHSRAVGDHYHVCRLLDRAPEFAQCILCLLPLSFFGVHIRLLPLPFFRVHIDGIANGALDGWLIEIRSLDDIAVSEFQGRVHRGIVNRVIEKYHGRTQTIFANLVEQAQCIAVSRCVFA